MGPLNQKGLIQILSVLLKGEKQLCFALLFGSYAKEKNTKNSDLDIAFMLPRTTDPLKRLAYKEELRNKVQKELLSFTSRIDLVDLQHASLSICSDIIEKNIILQGDGSLELCQFFTRVWALEEEFYWRLNYENRSLSS